MSQLFLRKFATFESLKVPSGREREREKERGIPGMQKIFLPGSVARWAGFFFHSNFFGGLHPGFCGLLKPEKKLPFFQLLKKKGP